LLAHLVRQAGDVGKKSDTLTVWLGDLLAYGATRRFRGQIKAYAEAAGMQPATLRNAKLVCSRIPHAARNQKLSWSHHCEIARGFSDAPKIQEWMNLAVHEGWSKAELRKRIRASKRETTPPPTTPAGGTPVFFFLRELRSLDRLIQVNQPEWRQWPSETCQFALSEIPALVAFVGELQSRTAGNESQSHAS
jgi:hypothetical protein